MKFILRENAEWNSICWSEGEAYSTSDVDHEHVELFPWAFSIAWSQGTSYAMLFSLGVCRCYRRTLTIRSV